MLEQYRYAVENRYWELPQGSWERNPDADHFQLAKGKLEEETGLIAKKKDYIEYQFLAYGYSSQGYHVYLGSGLSESSKNLDDEEEGLISKKFSLVEFATMIINGIIKDATTVNGYGLVKRPQHNSMSE